MGGAVASAAGGETEGDALLVVSLEGFEGPIDLLLHLAREQKLDLSKLSILRLAEQYLAFMEQARALRLDVAADYLVMAAWLAYLKSRLLLPKQERGTDEEEPTGEELAAALAWQIRRLEAMHKAASDLLALPQKGIHVFSRGAREGALETVVQHQPTATLYDLMAAYATIKKRGEKPSALRFEPVALHSIDEAIERLRESLGFMPDWVTMERFLPAVRGRGMVGRSAWAATLVASLELAKQGVISVRQDQGFGPIWLRRTPEAEMQAGGGEDVQTGEQDHG